MTKTTQTRQDQTLHVRPGDCDLWERCAINGLLKWPDLVNKVPTLKKIPVSYFQNPLNGVVWEEAVRQAGLQEAGGPIAEQVLHGLAVERGYEPKSISDFMWGLADDLVARPARVNVPFYAASVVARSFDPAAVSRSLRTRLDLLDELLGVEA